MKYCVFSLATGIIRSTFDTPEADAEGQLRSGEAIFFGVADPLRHRIVQVEGVAQVIDASKEDHGDGSVWDIDDGRRIPVQEQRARADALIKRRIDELERKQMRAMRENELKPSDRDQGGKTAKDRLQAIDDEIATLRAQLSV